MPRIPNRDTPPRHPDRSPPAAPGASSTPADLLARYEVVPIASLKPHPRNYQTHAADQQEHLRASLTSHDQYKNVVTANDGTILAGHGLIEAAQSLGKTHVVIVRMPYAPDDDRARQLMIGDNEIERLAHKNDRELAALLEELQSSGGGEALLGTGFDTLMLSGLLYEPPPGGGRPGVGGGSGEGLATPALSPWEPGPPGGMQVIQLVMDEGQAGEFEAAVDALADAYGTEGLTDTLIACVRRALEALRGEREGA